MWVSYEIENREIPLLKEIRCVGILKSYMHSITLNYTTKICIEFLWIELLLLFDEFVVYISVVNVITVPTIELRSLLEYYEFAGT